MGETGEREHRGAGPAEPLSQVGRPGSWCSVPLRSCRSTTMVIARPHRSSRCGRRPRPERGPDEKGSQPSAIHACTQSWPCSMRAVALNSRSRSSPRTSRPFRVAMLTPAAFETTPRTPPDIGLREQIATREAFFLRTPDTPAPHDELKHVQQQLRHPSRTRTEPEPEQTPETPKSRPVYSTGRDFVTFSGATRELSSAGCSRVGLARGARSA